MGVTKLSSTGSTNGDQTFPIARLIEFGRKQSFVTVDDILRLIPYPEKDIEQVDQAFAALMSAGIPYIDESDSSRQGGPSFPNK